MKELNRNLCHFVLCIAAAFASGCIENDIPYPVVVCNIESIAARGLSGDPVIDAAGRYVKLPLLETTDIQAVEITGAVVTEGAEASQEIVGVHDLRVPLYVTLSLYQDYPWRIEAEQTIERSFTVAGQIGATEWNAAEHTATVHVGFRDHSSVEVLSLKLGPAGITTMSCADVPELTEDNLYRLYDFTAPRRIEVVCHGRTEIWWLSVEYTDVKVSWSHVDPWSHSAWLYAQGLSGSELGFRYREAGAGEWTEVARESVTADGGSFRAQLRGLRPESAYEVVAYSDGNLSAVETFTTEAALPLPNGGFEAWSKPKKIVYPYLTEADAFWDSGNKGSATVGETICEGVSDIRPGSSGAFAALLTSKFASLAGIGKFAAGNIFIGTYAETVGTNGKVNFGRPFAAHPIALRGWLRYTQGKIDRIDKQPAGMTLTKEDFDEGSIYVALGTWTAGKYGGTEQSPVQVYTKDQSTFFDKDGEDVVAYGELILKENVGEWRQFTIELDWRVTDVVPTHLMIVCSASRWGDYFTGSTASRMWLDDFELIYDDAEL
ncbi:PCMD domain-containing protein [Alistipes senegalensis]|uniref:PCMD domain-containing protein n=1 Tax=Alistipes senegalensis TaxID=1288121 RepID=UPI0018AC29F7|nr:PCMD domain-containing protein [Alistipes senegalensis]